MQSMQQTRVSTAGMNASRAVVQPTLALRPARPSCVCAASSHNTSVDVELPTSRRQTGLMMASVAVASCMAQWSLAPPPATAAGFKKELKKKKLTEEDYTPSESVGLPIYELEEGKGGEEIKEGDRVVVHYDCIYRGLDVVSSRAARLLGGNRTIAEPYDYVVGEAVLGQPLRKISEGANGLFAGSGGPKPPPALSRAVIGMRKGGKRSVLVNVPELGYPKGQQEIPAGATFELKVEVLEISKRA